MNIRNIVQKNGKEKVSSNSCETEEKKNNKEIETGVLS